MFHRPDLWRRGIALLLSALLLAAVFSPPVQQTLRLPARMRLLPGQSCPLPAGVSASSSMDQTLSTHEGFLTAEQTGSAEVSLRLLGVFPLGRLSVHVAPGRTLIPGGQAVGVGMEMAGVMVVGVSSGSDAARHIRAGDTLLQINGTPISDANALRSAVQTAMGAPVTLSCLREGRLFTARVTPSKDENGYQLGVWVRSSTAGVGTLTYFDPQTGAYGALGHGVNDGDTGAMFPVRTGKLWRASVVDVKKGLRGAPGELRGSFLKENRLLGDIRINTPLGVYGRAQDITSPLYSSGLPVGDRSAVHTGRAQILSTVDEGGVRAYDVEIVEVTRQKSAAPKSFVLRVTDEALIEKTGGIVQGMSGSPVIQDGLIIGAVTHVFVDDPLMGYGLYIEWMLEQSDGLAEDKAA